MGRMPRVDHKSLGSLRVVAALASLAWITGCASQPTAKTPAKTPTKGNASKAASTSAPRPRPPNGVELSKVVKDASNGLSLEPETERETLLGQARKYIRYRTGRMTPQEKSIRRTHCRSGKLDPNLCGDVLGDTGGRPERSRSRKKKRSGVGSAALASAIKKGNLTLLKAASEQEILTALKRISKPSQLERTITAIDQEKACLPSAMLSALGLRMEQYLPDPRYRGLVDAYYSRADRCGDDDLSTLRARYRLALLEVSNDRCAVAEPLLKKVAESDEGPDYRSRAYYWRFRCAGVLNDHELEAFMRDRILDEFPFSLHALLVSPSEGPSHAVKPGGRDPVIAFRSETQAGLNPLVRAIEAVQSEGGSAASFRLLERLLERMSTKAEPEFQLYVAVLLRRSGDVIRKFQLLSKLLRANPELSSQESLEMLYPLQQFELVRSQVTDTDPYLVLSLIRQESAFNTRARSPAGARGLMQLMPGTARRMERVTRTQLYDPTINVRLGVRFFSGLVNRYSGDVELALAAYNAGPLRADDWVRRYPFSDRMLFVDMIPFKETREYVASIARNYYWYLKLYEQQSPSNRAEEKSMNAFALFSAIKED